MKIPAANYYRTYLAVVLSDLGKFFPVLNINGTLLPGEDTLTYPCISW